MVNVASSIAFAFGFLTIAAIFVVGVPGVAWLGVRWLAGRAGVQAGWGLALVLATAAFAWRFTLPPEERRTPPRDKLAVGRIAALPLAGLAIVATWHFVSRLASSQALALGAGTGVATWTGRLVAYLASLVVVSAELMLDPKAREVWSM